MTGLTIDKTGESHVEYEFFDPALSWLSFNYRVLQEAADPLLPVHERIRFLALYKSNLQKFYLTGLTAYRILPEVIHPKKQKNLDDDILVRINNEIDKQDLEFENIFSAIFFKELVEHQLELITDLKKLENFAEYTKKIFFNEILPFIQPVLLSKDENPKSVRDNALYLAIDLKKRKASLNEDGTDKQKSAYALIKVPTDKIPRFIELPVGDSKKYFVFIEDLIRYYLNQVFPLYHIKAAHSFISIRNSKLKIEDEFKRKQANRLLKNLMEKKSDLPPRFIYDRNISDEFLKVLKKAMNLSKKDMFPGYPYQKLSDMALFPPTLLPMPDIEKMQSLHHSRIDNSTSIIKAVKNHDILLHFPYHKFDYVIRFFNEAAIDPKVEEIKTTQYKLESNSAIVNALISAALNGKKVTIYVDFKARIDDSSNLSIIERMVESGIQVIPSIHGSKIHAKAALVLRRSSTKEDKKSAFAYFGTGNFNEKTARHYSDHGLFTSNKEITEDLKKIFLYLENPQIQPKLNHLIIPKFKFRKYFKSLINAEIQNAIAGKKAYIAIKTNNLEDKKLIKNLYMASQAGVKIDLIIRGICCLIPGEAYSKNIRVYRIIDKFLEHSRICMFHNNANSLVFLTSADLMKPVLDRRIDLMVPIYDPWVKSELENIIKIQLSDSIKSRILGKFCNDWTLPENGNNGFIAQTETFHYLKKIHENHDTV
jgi:polyphosphate kinase